MVLSLPLLTQTSMLANLRRLVHWHAVAYAAATVVATIPVITPVTTPVKTPVLPIRATILVRPTATIAATVVPIAVVTVLTNFARRAIRSGSAQAPIAITDREFARRTNVTREATIPSQTICVRVVSQSGCAPRLTAHLLIAVKAAAARAETAVTSLVQILATTHARTLAMSPTRIHAMTPAMIPVRSRSRILAWILAISPAVSLALSPAVAVEAMVVFVALDADCIKQQALDFAKSAATHVKLPPIWAAKSTVRGLKAPILEFAKTATCHIASPFGRAMPFASHLKVNRLPRPCLLQHLCPY